MNKTVEPKESKKIINITIDEAIKLLPEVSKSKFVGSVDIDIVLNLKEKQKKEVVRGSVTLPHSLGDEKKVIVLCEEKDEKSALEAGAIKAGLDSVVEELMNGFGDFDIVIATPSIMPKIVRLGKVLGPKGLMPNPKNGTITTEVGKTVESFRAGKMNFKSAQDQATIRLKIAKVDMKADFIKDNLIAVLKAVQSETKKLTGTPFKKVTLSPTMGSGLRLDISDIMKNV